ncbi:MAG: hypothetical protein EXR57_01890 [Dehalococcoidia bacterium]|nr:hypothetical protein [Dehalococcoidia bacterium]MSQ34553.1 hypothetical protein [Dehalococcoidia bacterium]
MSQVWVEVEESPNCPYSPLQTFEAKGPERNADALFVREVSGHSGPHLAVGWSSEGGGSPCPIRYVLVGDSGAGTSLLVAGGDFGIRLRPAASDAVWSMDAEAQWGEPYMLLDPGAPVRPVAR